MVYHMNAFFIMCISFSEKSLSEFWGDRKENTNIATKCVLALLFQLDTAALY